MANGLLPAAAIVSGDAPVLDCKLPPGPGRSPDDVGAHQLARIYRAVIGVVAENGYENLTVRDVVQRAEVSTRSFYKHFESKDDCMLRTLEIVVRRIARRVVAAQAGERDWQERLRVAFGAFVRELASEPQAARFVLVEAYSAGPAALERVRHAERIFEAMIAESFSRAPDGIVVPRAVVEGIVAGVEHVVRGTLLAGREIEPATLGDPLTEWALSYRREAVTALADLHCAYASAGPAIERSPTGDRAVLLSSVAKLAAADGYGQLTVAGICRVAGVSRSSFDRHFQGIEDCFLAALRERGDESIAGAADLQPPSRSWADGVHRAVVGFCAQLAGDPMLARLLFVEPYAAGARGVACSEQLMTRAAGRLLRDAPADVRIAEPALAASVGAAWGVLARHVPEGRAGQLAPTLAYLVLAPVIGAERSIAVIHRDPPPSPALALTPHQTSPSSKKIGESQDAHA